MPPGVTASALVTTPLTWTRTCTATGPHIREARQFLSGILRNCEGADDAVLCLSELATNAAIHSNSSKSGGTFTVSVQMSARGLRVEVLDQGGSWTWPTPPDEQHGRGLLIVSKLSGAWGRTGSSEDGWTTWFEMPLQTNSHGASAAANLRPSPAPTSTSRPPYLWTSFLDGRQLRHLRRECSMSQEQLAEAAGISTATVGRLERQPRASCRGRTLARLAAALGEDPVALTRPGAAGG